MKSTRLMISKVAHKITLRKCLNPRDPEELLVSMVLTLMQVSIFKKVALTRVATKKILAISIKV